DPAAPAQRAEPGSPATPAQRAEAGAPATLAEPAEAGAPVTRREPGRRPAARRRGRSRFPVTGQAVGPQAALLVQGHRFLLAHGSSFSVLASSSPLSGRVQPGAAVRCSGPMGADQVGRTTSNSLPA